MNPIRRISGPLCVVVVGLCLAAATPNAGGQTQDGTSPAMEVAASPPVAVEPGHEGHDHAPGEGHDHATPDHSPRTGFDFEIWERVAIQEEGLQKSFSTYAREHVRELTGNMNYGGRGPIENVFSMAFEPEPWIHEKMLKVSYPELKKVFANGEKRLRISPMDLEQKRDQWKPLTEGEHAAEVKKELNHLYEKVDLALGKTEKLKFVPALKFDGSNDIWRSVEEMAGVVRDKSGQEQQLASAWADVKLGFVMRDAARFNTGSAAAVAALHALRPMEIVPDWRINLDRWDSKVGLFRLAGWTYLVSALIFLVSYLAGRTLFTVAGGVTLGFGAGLHVAALIIRGLLAERTPVANLFESAVFIIGVMTVIALVISIYYRTRVVGLAGSVLGAFFMGMANNIPLQYGRKILPLIDALQSYWLHIHVTSMLASYAFFALSFFISMAYLLRRFVLNRTGVADVAADQTMRYLDGLNFRIITIGFPILTGGVILGAVWASEAWGRPWAFDPKETAAAITWMIYALYLHCRLFLGWKGTRGMWLSLLGAAAVAFTYLGVSFFLPGLHSYVSQDGVSFWGFLKRLIPGL